MTAKIVFVMLAIISLAIMASAQGSQRDYLLLENGDKILVNFPAGSNGSIQFKSLSARSRVDVENTAKRGVDKVVLTDKEGWKAYPAKVDGADIAITLREAKDNDKDLATTELPVDSDVVVRIVNSAPPRVAGGDNSKRGTKCPLCNRTLDW
jgi:Skp family chaperone for outer membrane proteins